MVSEELKNALLDFRARRDWEQFHTVRNLCTALVIEAGELLEPFRWSSDSEAADIVAQKKSELESEIADVAILLTYICNDMGVNLEDAVRNKLLVNETRYPVDRARGSSKKYNES